MPYQGYPSGEPDRSLYRPVSEQERRAIKKNYSAAFIEAVIHSIGTLVFANIFFVIMMLSGYEFRINDDGLQVLDIPYLIAACIPSVIICLGLFIFDKAKSGNKLSEYFRSDKITAGMVFGFFGVLMFAYAVGMIMQQILIAGCFAVGVSPIKEGYLCESELSVPYLIIDVFLTGIIGPIAEELMFRGVILRRLSIVSQRFAIFASALIFGMMHLNILQMVMAFSIGLVLGYAAVKTGSLLLPIAGHMFINMFAVSNEIMLFLTDEDTAEVYWMAYLGVFLLIGAVALVIILSRRKLSLPKSTDYHSSRTFPIIVTCVSFWVMSAIYIIEIISKFGPVTDKLLEQ